MKKTIRYFYLGFWKGDDVFEWIKSFLSPIKEKYIFVEDGVNPEFLFYGCFLNFTDLQKFPKAIKIFLSGENVSPDFIYFDYCVGPDFLIYNNRYFRLPLVFWGNLTGININSISINEKKYFCDFCYSHDRSDMLRKKLYEKFSEYKKVINSGTYLNKNFNVTGNKIAYKKSIQRLCRFSLIIETTEMEGFITEKLSHALESNTIPIYFGTNKVFFYFNKKRIIYGYDFKTIDDLLNYVIKIDKDDELYKQILSENLYNSNFSIEEYKQEFSKFFSNIFDKKIMYREIEYRPAFFMRETVRDLDRFHFKLFFAFKRAIKKAFKPFFKH